MYESWVYTGFNFILGLPIIFFGMMDRDLTAEFVLKYPQVYLTGKSNKLLKLQAIAVWIFNAVVYAVVISLLFFLSAAPTFNTYGIYEAGTVIFVGLCNTLQMKVAFFHHQWAYPNVAVMIISVGGMLIYFLIIAVTTYEYYYIANDVYELGMFWFYGFFSVPIFTVFIDWIGYYCYMFFWPTTEMLYRDVMIQVRLVASNLLKNMPMNRR